MTLSEAHKKGRKYRRIGEKYWMKLEEDDKTTTLDMWDAVYADDWEVEPEVYGTETVWTNRDGFIFPEMLGGATWSILEGKRTKLTIEVLD